MARTLLVPVLSLRRRWVLAECEVRPGQRGLIPTPSQVLVFLCFQHPQGKRIHDYPIAHRDSLLRACFAS